MPQSTKRIICKSTLQSCKTAMLSQSCYFLTESISKLVNLPNIAKETYSSETYQMYIMITILCRLLWNWGAYFGWLVIIRMFSQYNTNQMELDFNLIGTYSFCNLQTVWGILNLHDIKIIAFWTRSLFLFERCVDIKHEAIKWMFDPSLSDMCTFVGNKHKHKDIWILRLWQ